MSDAWTSASLFPFHYSKITRNSNLSLKKKKEITAFQLKMSLVRTVRPHGNPAVTLWKAFPPLPGGSDNIPPIFPKKNAHANSFCLLIQCIQTAATNARRRSDGTPIYSTRVPEGLLTDLQFKSQLKRDYCHRPPPPLPPAPLRWIVILPAVYSVNSVESPRLGLI